MNAYFLKFHGRVQGVCYRDFVRENALDLGLRGRVKNDPEGTVTAFVQGEEAALEELIERCRQGPPAAEVEKIEKKTAEKETGLEGFEIIKP